MAVAAVGRAGPRNFTLGERIQIRQLRLRRGRRDGIRVFERRNVKAPPHFLHLICLPAARSGALYRALQLGHSA